MRGLFGKRKRQPSTLELSLVTLCDDGYCAVVGESHYQDSLRRASRTCSAGEDGRPTFLAALVAEPSNPYDANAIAVLSTEGKLGYLARETAVEYRDLFRRIAGLGYDGGACEAHLVGGTADKPYLGVVLQLASPALCLAELLEDDA